MAGSHGGYREEDNRASLLVLAMFVSLLGGTFFLLGATYFKMPVSTTHTIVGSIVGTTIVAVGAKCVHWGWEDGHGVTAIAMSWVLSPLLSGIVSLGLFALVQRLVFAARDPVAAGLTFMPPAYGVTLFFLVFMILDKSSLTKGKLTVLEILAVAATTGGLAALAARLLLVPRLRRRTEGGKLNNGSSATKANPTFEEDKGTSSLDVDATEVDADGYDGEIEQEMNDVALDAEGGDSFEDDGVAMSGRLEDDGTITTMGEMGGKSDDGFGMEAVGGDGLGDHRLRHGLQACQLDACRGAFLVPAGLHGGAEVVRAWCQRHGECCGAAGGDRQLVGGLVLRRWHAGGLRGIHASVDHGAHGRGHCCWPVGVG